MICSRYFSEMPCLAAMSFTLMHWPVLCRARSSITLVAYLPFVEIFMETFLSYYTNGNIMN